MGSKREALRGLRRVFSGRFTLLLSVTALLCSALIIWFLKFPGSQGASLVWLLYINIALFVLLVVLVGRRLIVLWKDRKKGLAGSKLHTHLVLLFSLVTIIPTLLLGFFSFFFFDIGVNNLLGKPIERALEQAQKVAQAYANGQQESIKMDAHAMVSFLQPRIQFLKDHPEQLSEVLTILAEARGLGEVLVFNREGRILGKSHLTFALVFDTVLLDYLEKGLNNLRANQVWLSRTQDRVRALTPIDLSPQVYLFVGKVTPQNVLGYLNQTHQSLENFKSLSSHYSHLHLTFLVFFGLLALILLLTSIWWGLMLSNNLIRPIRKIIAAAEHVSQGNLKIKVDIPNLHNELDDLALSFNRMVSQLQRQQHDLALSQRKAAWADVARKIAHEIKNPLTPIQLSAERLKRRYLKEIHSDPQTFQACIDTIVRQVASIGNLVKEFSSFARMPEPQIQTIDVAELAHHLVCLQQQAYPGIEFIFQSPKELTWSADPNYFSQLFLNLLQNAINALVESHTSSPKIWLSLGVNAEGLWVVFEDNGPGFPLEHREKLLEPYYTTREKGTGLGLAIVSRIVSEHNGFVELSDREGGGAQVILCFRSGKEK